MIITKRIAPGSCDICCVVGHGKLARKVPVFKLESVEQLLVYDLDAKGFDDRGMKVRVTLYDVPADPKAAGGSLKSAPIDLDGNLVEGSAIRDGNWSLDTFNVFVDGVRMVTQNALAFLQAGLEAQAMITESTYVWSRMRTETVGKGLFKKGEEISSQLIRFAVFGIQTDDVPWDPEMLQPLVGLRDGFLREKDQFMAQIKSIL